MDTRRANVSVTPRRGDFTAPIRAKNAYYARDRTMMDGNILFRAHTNIAKCERCPFVYAQMYDESRRYLSQEVQGVEKLPREITDIAPKCQTGAVL